LSGGYSSFVSEEIEIKSLIKIDDEDWLERLGLFASVLLLNQGTR